MPCNLSDLTLVKWLCMYSWFAVSIFASVPLVLFQSDFFVNLISILEIFLTVGLSVLLVFQSDFFRNLIFRDYSADVSSLIIRYRTVRHQDNSSTKLVTGA